MITSLWGNQLETGIWHSSLDGHLTWKSEVGDVMLLVGV